MLTKKQFDILDSMANQETALSQRKIASLTKMSIGTVNRILSGLISLGFVQDNKITQKGLDVLEPYRVKRAVIIAAGFGSRLVPITLNTPKPLVRVNGKRIIETILDPLIDIGIEEIYLVRGYLSTQFDDLLYKYPNIKFIDNLGYNESNNIGSVYCAREFLEDAYVLEADLLLYNKKLIKKYQYSTNYLGIPVQETNDWCLFTKNGIVNEVKIGGQNCYKMVGISYWTKEDGKKLSADVEKIYHSPGGTERYWDQVPLEYCKKNYKISVRECQAEDIVEIDTFNELKAIDPSYNV